MFLFICTDLKDQIKLMEKSVSSKEARFVSRVFRTLSSTRKKLTPFLLKKILNLYYVRPESKAEKEILMQFIDGAPDLEIPADKLEKGMLYLIYEKCNTLY